MKVTVYSAESKKTAFFSYGVKRRSIITNIGEKRKRHEVYEFSKKGDFLSCSFNVSENAESLTLCIGEVHEARRCAFGYTVSVLGSPVYFRSFEELLTAPFKYMFRLPAGYTKNGRITLRIENACDEQFCIESLTLIENIEDNAKNGNCPETMDILEFNRDVRTQDERYSKDKAYSFGLQQGLSFLQRPLCEIFRDVASAIDLCAEEGKPLSLMPSRWWGHSPGSPDGQGGYFTDYKYGQVCYNFRKKRYEATTPNMWGSTLWTTMNSELQNKIANKKLERIAAFCADYLLLAKKKGRNVPRVRFVIEWGSGYWSAPELGGDFGDEITSLAKEYGVELNPENGLTEQMRDFLNYNITLYNDAIARSLHSGMGHGGITVTSGKVEYPTKSLSDNIYTHCLQDSLYPSFDSRHAGFVGGVGKYMFPSSEMYAFTDPRILEYQLMYGNLICANLEMTMLSGNMFSDYLRQCYQLGMEALTMFNPTGTEGEQLSLACESFDDNYTVPVYLRCFYEINYPALACSYTPLTTDSTLTEYHGVYFRTDEPEPCLADDGAEGYVILFATDPAQKKDGLYLELDARGDVSVSVGVTPDDTVHIADTKETGRISWFNPHHTNRFELTKYLSDNTGLYIKITLNAPDSSISRIRLLLGWDRSLTDIHNVPETLRDKRTENMLIARMAGAENIVAREPDTVKTACEKLSQWLPCDAERELTRVQSLRLPCRMALSGKGKLPGMPVFFECECDTVLTVLSDNARGILLRLFSDRKCTLRLRFEHRYALINKENNEYLLEPEASGNTEFSLYFTPPVRHTPLKLTGLVTEVTDSRISLRSQDTDYTEHEDISTAEFDSKCHFVRCEREGEHPCPLDYVTLWQSGGKITQCIASRDEKVGVLTALTLPRLRGGNLHNGIITLSDGSQYELCTNKTLIKVIGKEPITQNHIDVNCLGDYLVKGRKYRIVADPHSYSGALRRVYEIEETE